MPKDKNESGNDFLKAIQSRNEEEVKKIYSLYFPKVRAFVLKNSGTIEDAKDIFNLVIYQFSARLAVEEFEIKSTFEAYLFTACKNMWRRELNRRKKQRVTNPDVTELYYSEKDLSQSVLEEERWELFHEKLSELSDNCKQVLELYLSNLSSKEIMEKLGYSSESTVRQRIFKCKQGLMKIIQNDPRFNELKAKK